MDSFARAAALARCPILDRVPAAAVLAVAERAASLELVDGAPLPVRSDAGDAVLVIASGHARLGDAELGPGALVGELAAIDDEAPAPAATAAGPLTVVRIYRDDFLDLLAEHAVAADALARDLALRIRR